jgi:acyl carrier protein
MTWTWRNWPRRHCTPGPIWLPSMSPHAPTSDIERRIAGIWQTVIGIAPVGIQDSFFDLGGSSLLAIQVISLLNKEFKAQVPVTSLFEGGTVASLAKVIAEDHALAQAFEASQSRGEERRARARRGRGVAESP